MLELKPSVDKQVILPYCRACGKLYSDAYYLYRALDGGAVLAVALFLVGGDQVDIVYYESAEEQDYSLFDAVLRAGLNYAASFGIALGHIPEAFRERHFALFRHLNFPPEPVFNITNFFQKYKNCRPG